MNNMSPERKKALIETYRKDMEKASDPEAKAMFAKRIKELESEVDVALSPERQNAGATRYGSERENASADSNTITTTFDAYRDKGYSYADAITMTASKLGISEAEVAKAEQVWPRERKNDTDPQLTSRELELIAGWKVTQGVKDPQIEREGTRLKVSGTNDKNQVVSSYIEVKNSIPLTEHRRNAGAARYGSEVINDSGKLSEDEARYESKKVANVKKVSKLWSQGRNVWEISQLTGLPESVVRLIVSSL